MAKGKFKKALKKLTGKAKNIANHIIEAEKNVAKGVEAAALLPFAPFMKMAVKKKGAKPEKKIIPLAKQFIELVIKQDGGSSYEMAYYECLAAQNLETGMQEEHLAEDIASIVKLVVEWIQKIRKKKESGAELTKAEAEALKEADLINETDKKLKESEAMDESKNAGFKNVSGKSFDTKTIGIIAVVLIAAYFVTRK